MQVTIFSTTTCPYCKMLKDYFATKNVAFTEKLVDTDETARAEMEQVSKGFMGVPFTKIVKDDGQTETVIGFDQGKLNTIFQTQ